MKTFTGLPSTKCFKCIFDHLLPKAAHMQYWRGPKQTTREASQHYGNRGMVLPKCRPGPGRKLDLEQEFLLTLMKLKLGIINEDLAFRFMVSSLSSVFITWIKLMSKELSVLNIWPSKQQVKDTLPVCFKKLYRKVRCIIDCFECFTETPNGSFLRLSPKGKHRFPSVHRS